MVKEKEKKEAREEGHAEGRAEGIAKGIAEGIEQNKKEMIFNMYKEKVPIETIAKCATLTVDEIKKLLKRIRINLIFFLFYIYFKNIYL